jgi:cytochrome c peroxidase
MVQTMEKRNGSVRGLVIAAAAMGLLVTAAGVRAADVTIEQSGQRFSENSLVLKSGDTVTFANRDDVTHNITVVDDDDDTADLGLQKPGQSLTYRFDKAGRFKVRCTIHPSVRMPVTVK